MNNIFKEEMKEKNTLEQKVRTTKWKIKSLQTEVECMEKRIEEIDEYMRPKPFPPEILKRLAEKLTNDRLLGAPDN